MSSQLPAEYRAYMRRLERMAEGTFSRVIADTINTVAGFAHIQSIRNARDRLTYRNAYTERSIRFYKANPKANAAKINAITGSVQPYMATQDTGGKRRPRRGREVMEVTKAARGGSYTGVVRRRFVTVGAKMPKSGPKMFVGVPRGVRRAGPSAGSMAPYGLYLRTNSNHKLQMIRKMDRSSVPIDATKWHSDAMAKFSTRKVMTDEFLRQARYLLKK